VTKKKREKKERKARQAKQDSAKRRKSEEVPDLTALPDPRAMERMSANIGKLLEEQEFDSIEEAQAFLDRTLLAGGGILPEASAPNTPLEKAQDLVYEALETESARKRIQLAKRALKTSGDCADAYVLLAEEDAGSLEEARELYQKGVEAGERALGRETFEEDAGHFWGILETRPYMRARQGLAFCLWELGERREAIDHYKQMLDLNPDDNQGIRHELASCLLDEELDEELGDLLERYEEDVFAEWAYTRAIWAFRQKGDTEEATEVLEEAIEINPYVPLYLLGHKILPRALPDLMTLGNESEAVSYVARALTVWLRTPSALEWLRGNVDQELLAELQQEE
jgi:tetratricopeptide (TPR) repeat protein